MKEMVVDAITQNVELVTDFVNSYLEELNCPRDIIFKLDVAIDEVFSNIVKYSYGDTVGSVTVKVRYEVETSVVTVEFQDEGIKYNPLEKEDPDISKVMDDDSIGGLGVYLTKSLMDDISYQYNDGKNILIIYKKTSGK